MASPVASHSCTFRTIMSKKKFFMMRNEQTVQVCDATKAAQSVAAGNPKIKA